MWKILVAIVFSVLSEATANSLYSPIKNGKVTSDYGIRSDPFDHEDRFHSGLDIAVAEGTPIYAISSGQVIYAGDYFGYGKLIVIRHGKSVVSLYGHCKKITVQIGEYVEAGVAIGEVGTTGRVTGPHLHFEMRFNGLPFDPAITFFQDN